jgi:hypothetical protein
MKFYGTKYDYFNCVNDRSATNMNIILQDPLKIALPIVYVMWVCVCSVGVYVWVL